MKNLILFTIFILVSSCKSSYTYVYEGVEKIPYHDTIVLNSIHFHYEDISHCVWIEELRVPYTDTIYIEKWSKTKQ